MKCFEERDEGEVGEEIQNVRSEETVFLSSFAICNTSTSQIKRGVGQCFKKPSSIIDGGAIDEHPLAEVDLSVVL